jgi:hypothetical protein
MSSWWVEMWLADRIQILFVSSLATVLLLKWASLYRLRAMLMGATPSNHLLCQNIAFSPLPNLITVDA